MAAPYLPEELDGVGESPDEKQQVQQVSQSRPNTGLGSVVCHRPSTKLLSSMSVKNIHVFVFDWNRELRKG